MQYIELKSAQQVQTMKSIQAAGCHLAHYPPSCVANHATPQEALTIRSAHYGIEVAHVPGTCDPRMLALGTKSA